MAFTINGQLFLTDIAAGVTRAIAIDESEFKPVLNPRISPDGRHIMYTTGTYLVDVDLAENTDDGDAVSVVASVPQIDGTIDEPSTKRRTERMAPRPANGRSASPNSPRARKWTATTLLVVARLQIRAVRNLRCLP